jgi:bifunctional ADP-heptose synthase (sugar kinase/adenylyltransferase)
MKKVLVIGDSCKDVFKYGRCERLCPEAPIPVFTPTSMNESGGMALNVYNNLFALGVDCEIITQYGITKTRYVDEVSNQMLLRVDESDRIFITPTMYNKLMECDYSVYDAIIISDYNKGFIDENLIEHIANSHPYVFMDTKKKINKWAKKVGYIKINKKEYNENASFLDMLYRGNLIVTQGNEGAIRFAGGSLVGNYPIEEEHNVRDLSGAGDTFLAGLVAKFLEDKDIVEAIKFANKCASWVVTQKGVVVIDQNKIKS